MHFSKADMELIHYRWQQDKLKADALFSGEPSRRSFDPLNGDQVLFMINYFGSFSKDFTLQEARALEQQIAFSLPKESQSEVSVLKWLHKMAAGSANSQIEQTDRQ
jgi:hypothetical protein